MRQTLSKSDNNIRIVNELIENGYYSGYIGPEKFELIPIRFPNNFRLIGRLNESESYDVNYGFKPPINTASRIALLCGMAATGVFLFKGSWMEPLIILGFGLKIIYDFRAKGKKEVKELMDRVLAAHKRLDKDLL